MQVAFNAAALILSTSLAYKFSHLVLTGSGTESPVVWVILAESIYSPVNSGLVSMVIGLAEGQPFRQVCERCYEWAFPYFMLGIALAGLVSGAYAPSTLWKGALVLLPFMGLNFVYFRNRSARPLPPMTLPSSTKEEFPVEFGA